MDDYCYSILNRHVLSSHFIETSLSLNENEIKEIKNLLAFNSIMDGYTLCVGTQNLFHESHVRRLVDIDFQWVRLTIENDGERWYIPEKVKQKFIAIRRMCNDWLIISQHMKK